MPVDRYDLILPCLVTLATLACPYTKVEESFNLQATHDLLIHGSNLSHYDHYNFPGVVPRTFLGPLFLSFLAWPTERILEWIMPIHPEQRLFILQLVVRLWLGAFTCIALSIFRRALSRATNAFTGRIFLLICASQFHLIFWASRPLPNLFAFPLVTIALARWIDSGAPQTLRSLSHLERRWSLYESTIWFTIAIAIFRSEILGLAGPLFLSEFIRSPSTLSPILLYGLFTLALSISITLLVDSYFWREWLMWPEWKVFYFNAIQQRSSDWGTSPWHAYWTSLIPRIAHASLIPAAVGILSSRACRRWLGPAIIFVGAYSMIGHKEWRFILYIIPLINGCAAVGVSALWRGGAGMIKGRLASFIRILTLSSYLLAIIGVWIMVGISSWNYPGGQALDQLHSLIPKDYPVHVHMDPVTAMTGASLFGERRRPFWSYAKDEDLDPGDYGQYTHLITSKPQAHEEEFEVLKAVQGYGGLQRQPLSSCLGHWIHLLKTLVQGKGQWREGYAYIASLLPIYPVLQDQLWIMQRRGE